MSLPHQYIVFDSTGTPSFPTSLHLIKTVHLLKTFPSHKVYKDNFFSLPHEKEG